MKKALIAASVMTTGALASTAILVSANAADRSVQPAVVTLVVADSAAVSENNSLLLQYVKETTHDEQDNQSNVQESWGDPLTYNQRTDIHFTDANNKVLSKLAFCMDLFILKSEFFC
ncbi:hypothetical protein [Paenibacillus medicaginis]|uniref:Uncharacterized protein n=1 Tax=Paenibacillus medicaginis TaxID=1470560 RepID=A0ABV5C4L9_9BACL